MITKDAIESKNKISKSIGEKVGFCWDFLTAKIRPIMYETIKECDYKLKEIDIKLAKNMRKSLMKIKQNQDCQSLGLPLMF